MASDFPRYRTDTGALVDLNWTRLIPVAEIPPLQPTPPARTFRGGIAVSGPSRVTIGSGFDRREVIVRQIVEDDGVFEIAGQPVSGRPQIGKELRDEEHRHWKPSDAGAQSALVREILVSHDFPVGLEWPGGVWTWRGDDLFWANRPDEGGELLEEPRSIAGMMSGIRRGGLDLGITRDLRDADPRAERMWPQFSAFGWALELWDDAEAKRRAAPAFLDRAQQRLAEATAREEKSPGVGLEDIRDAQAEVDRATSLDRWIQQDQDSAWSAGFRLGAYLAEYRIRSLHEPLLKRGERNLQATQEGQARRTADQKAEIDARRGLVASLAAGKLSGSPPSGRRWSRTDLAAEVREAWHEDQNRPSLRALMDDLAHLGLPARGR